MKISGFTIIKNAVLNDYPIVESIQSLLPLVDEMIVSIGDSEDDTAELIKSINSPKIKIHYSIWDKSVRKGGKILALETNKAMDYISPDTDWIFYLQADEVIHEKYYENIRVALTRFKDDQKVEGLLFNYVHFYGTYDYIGDSRKWYRCETRVIKNNRGIHSYGDAQGFRKNIKEKIKVAQIDASIYHYGWVKNPVQMKIKQKNVAAFWNDNDESLNNLLSEEDFFDYSDFDSLKKFEGSHPAVMQNRINKKNWHIELDIRKKKMKLKYRFLFWIEKLTGKRLLTFKNHIIVRK
jgi:hypothetical protein